MQTLIRQANSLLNKVNREIGKREKFFIKKPETWQESVTGGKYAAKTEMLHDLSDALEEQLTNFPPSNYKYNRY